VRDGDTIEFGRCRLQFLQTPGHTVESVSVVVTDLERGADPAAVLTGDTLFIGDVGRPDLSPNHTPQQLAGMLYDSLHRKILALPDSVQVYPAHGAGSMCGRNISADRSSTIGRERASNYALRAMPRERFVEMMTHDLPPRPEYFQRDADVNRHGAPALDSLPPLAALPAEEVLRRRQAGATLLDTRAATPYASGHVPGSVQIGLSGQFASWAGSILGLDRELILVAEDDAAAQEARLRLARVGIEKVQGYLADGVAGWARAGLPLAEMEQISVTDLQTELASPNDICVVDVRRQGEWDQGHVEGAILHPLDRLPREIESLDRNRPLAVHCKGGYRSMIACSLLEGAGFQRVRNLLGGYDAWAAAIPAVTR
jgi:rhodanese-related sulfurtransferase